MLNIKLLKISILMVFFVATVSFSQGNLKKENAITFKKSEPTHRFIAEGAAIGDVNKDGKKDVLSGAYWFEAPDWKAHELAKPDSFIVNGSYSNSFLNFAMDVNQDGWIDLIRVDWPGKATVWHENPKNKDGYWPVHMIYSSLGNESPNFVDMNGDGRPDILGNDPTEKKVIWLKAPSTKGDIAWERHIISNDENQSTHMYTHGIGFGDINGDGQKDVVVREGWWEGPAEGLTKHDKNTPWKFHKADIGKEASQMYVMDLNQDGLNDVISASAHNYGIWWHEQGRGADGAKTWKLHNIDTTFSQTHSLALVDMNSDGNLDLVTGKRYFAHNGHDPGEFEPAVMYWYEYKPGKTPQWIRHEIDNDSGSGLNVAVEDLNGDKLLDVVTSNKKGVHIFIQQK